MIQGRNVAILNQVEEGKLLGRNTGVHCRMGARMPTHQGNYAGLCLDL
jgi:hypothetical protein